MTSDLLDKNDELMKKRMMRVSKKMGSIMRKLYSKVTDNAIGESVLAAGGKMIAAASESGMVRTDGRTMNTLRDMNIALFDDELREIRATALGNLITLIVIMFLGAGFMSWIEGWTLTGKFSSL